MTLVFRGLGFGAFEIPKCLGLVEHNGPPSFLPQAKTNKLVVCGCGGFAI